MNSLPRKTIEKENHRSVYVHGKLWGHSLRITRVETLLQRLPLPRATLAQL